ncbi:S8 family serine peptidase [Candidatus Kuenenbacteria bacterium]|nr:S8 family serine peptidase [Candidatus Kuenenbacteria bacterium]
MKHKFLFTIFIIIFFFSFLFPAIALVPNDPDYSKQWYLSAIKANQAWDITTGSPEIIVAVLDGGVDIDHPDLIKNIWTNQNEIAGNGIDDDNNGYTDDINGWDFIENSNNPNPKIIPNYTKVAINHGTIIAGIIAAEGNNNQGISGISFKTKIMPLRILNEQGKGNGNNFIKAIDYAIKNGAYILNLSFTGNEEDKELLKAIERAWKAGVIIVAAAGNENSENNGTDLDKTPRYPICSDEQENMIIGVAAVDNKDQKTKFSSFGKCIDISAPGISFYGAQVYNSEEIDFKEYYGGYYSGTSIATPQIAAATALIWGQFPNLTNKEVQNFILNGADKIDEQNLEYKNKLGTGRLNVYQSLKLAQDSLKLAQNSEEILNSKKIIATSYKDNKTYLKIFNIDSNLNYQQIIYNQHFQGGVNVATGDIDGDGKNEIITGQKIGEPLVKVFDKDVNFKYQIIAYDSNSKGGVSVAIGDLDGDGKNEIITGQKIGEPLVKVFDKDGNLKYQVMAYDPNFKGGVNVTTGDIDGDGKDELIVGVAGQKNPYVRVYKIVENSLYLKFQIMAYDPNFKGGVNVTTGDIDGDGKNELITSQGEMGESIIKIFDEKANLKKEFKSFDPEFQNGVSLAMMSFFKKKRDKEL